MIDYGEYLMRQAGEDEVEEYIEPDDEYTGDEDGETRGTDERVGEKDGQVTSGERNGGQVEVLS